MLKLIIIDDEAIIRESLKHYIDWNSIDVEIAGLAANGSAGIELILEKQPDIILSDINMPLLNGIELIAFLNEHNITAEVIFISAYSKFEYAQAALHYKAFDYILKPIDEELLLSVVQKCTLKILQDRQTTQTLFSVHQNNAVKAVELMERLLCDYYFTASKLDQELLMEQHFYSTEYKTCIGAGIWLPDNFALESGIWKQLWEAYEKEYFIIKIKADESLLVVLFLSRDDDVSQLQSDFRKILTSVYSSLETHCNCVTITAGSPHPYPLHIHNIYAEIIVTKRLQTIAKKIDIFSSLQGKAQSHTEKPDPKDILNAIKNHCLHIADDFMYLLFMHLLSERNIYDLDSVKLHCFTFIDTFINQLKELHLHKYLDAATLSSKKNITSQCNLDLVYTVTKNILSNLILCVEDLSRQTSSQLVRSTIEYIHVNYAHNISLTEIANNLYVSPPYLSKLFSSEVGEPFSKYILQYRICQSKTLLKNSKYKIIDIAQMCGFSDVSHYSKSFKQLTGMSPNRYRNDII